MGQTPRATDQTTTAYVTGRFLWPILAGLRVLELPVEEIVASAGLPPSVFRDLEQRIPVDLALRIGEVAIAWSGRDDLGLEVARCYERGGFGLVDTLAQASATLGHALQHMARYETLYQTAMHAEVVRAGDLSRITHHWVERRRPPRFVSENNLASLVVIGRKLVGGELPLRRVRFHQPRPSDTRAHERLFACAIEWNAPEDELELDARALDFPVLGADPRLADLLDVYARSHAQAAHVLESWSLATRRLVCACMIDGLPDVTVVARRLGLSPRTLQRRLRDEGTSYASTLEVARQELATQYLTLELSVDEVAGRLGYRDARAFRRAFKRWTGQTTSRFRTSGARPDTHADA